MTWDSSLPSLSPSDFSGMKGDKGACSSCGGVSGHTVRCPHGPGPAPAPTFAELWAVVAALEFPAMEVPLPGRERPVQVPGRRLPWRGFLEWAARRPEAAVAVWTALEAYEQRWRAEAPTPAEVVG
jgi:hypothetical protein